MKVSTKLTLLALVGVTLNIVLGTLKSFAQSGTWTQKSDFGGIKRSTAVGFSIGTKGYIGTGYNGSGVYYKDFWEWDQATDTWTQKADFGGTARMYAVGFSIGTKGYIGTGGITNTAWYQDFWEWDQATNVWTQKANFGGSARISATGFSIGTKGYIGTGWDNTTHYQDFWEWDQATDTWTQKANFGGTVRYGSSGFSIGTKGYIGIGMHNTLGSYQDFWEWDQATDTWTQKANFGGTARQAAGEFSIGSKGYIGMGYAGGPVQDFWEWDQTTDIWTQKADFCSNRVYPVSFSIGTKGYIGTGNVGGTRYKDFWEFDPAGAGSSCLPLPIELLNFNATAENNSLVRCEWSTATEINSDYFAVERAAPSNSPKGGGNSLPSGELGWAQIGTVQGAGNSSFTRNYIFYDHEPYIGISYYRLRPVDYDGTFSYSQIRAVYIGTLNLITIYPNPSTNGSIEYTVASETGAEVTVKVYDVLGRKVISNTETIDGGVVTKELSTAALSSGSYLLQVTNGDMEKTQKQFVIK